MSYIDALYKKDEDKVYVVDFFFTRCPSICPVMTDYMLLIQNEFINNDQFMLLSLSVTPNIDSVPVLKKYANEKGVEDSKWNLTTGSKKHIYDLHTAEKGKIPRIKKASQGGFSVL